MQLIKNYASWNGYPKHIVCLIAKRSLRDKDSNSIKEESTTDTVKIFDKVELLKIVLRNFKNVLKKKLM